VKQIDIWTDGSCDPNPNGFGGWAVVIKYGDKTREFSGSQLNATNNRMEMLAALSAFKCLKEPCLINIRTDSQYLVNAFKQKWIVKWMKNGWKTSTKEPVKNRDLWEELWEQTQVHKVEWTWVKGHAKDEYNNRCDELANQARKDLEAIS